MRRLNFVDATEETLYRKLHGHSYPITQQDFLVDSGKGVRNRARRQQLARISELLSQLAAALKPLTADSEAPGLATEGLGLLFEWIERERETAMSAPRSVADGVRDDHPR